jgi:hypothetical protein
LLLSLVFCQNFTRSRSRTTNIRLITFLENFKSFQIKFQKFLKFINSIGRILNFSNFSCFAIFHSATDVTLMRRENAPGKIQVAASQSHSACVRPPRAPPQSCRKPPIMPKKDGLSGKGAKCAGKNLASARGDR